MGAISITRKRRPATSTKFIVNYFTEEDKEYFKKIDLSIKGVVLSFRRAEITKVEEGWEIYTRDWDFFRNNKELTKFKKENAW